ncbi:DUF3180 domain-containing protein [Microbacterium azadirachtae]|uniref:DUF3180 domain-containing protein n=1 Tax=Microbacterium azadirachtae TaxID=582680 RepID=A0A0F0KFV7_9MICO|nr:DUF3180 domain-containing protein [Microbacterium azadirachtae]KJL19767.1 hypothetical protein RL72_02810 [Microbacterium azadirachtae]UXW86391.1 DUF3180 domain-containing protein [Microbacterium azadirachtae]SDL94719.1 Protein of unknown function [Microbacterium azadirachtae]SEG13350.1 Protein of unknown function [Microbacterium azadirachtae]SEG15934.1 Protein of unknown function [Microbacterium azadirachtae]
MRRISPVLLLVLALAGAAAGFLIDHALTTAGRPTFTPSIVLPIFLVLLAVAVLALAWPIRRSTRSATSRRVDPFRAVRIAMLARASSLVGAVITGFGAGLGAYLLSRPITPPIGSIIATAVAALVLTIAAVIAESFCLLPGDGPPDPDGQNGPRLEDDDDDSRAAADTGH